MDRDTPGKSPKNALGMIREYKNSPQKMSPKPSANSMPVLRFTPSGRSLINNFNASRQQNQNAPKVKVPCANVLAGGLGNARFAACFAPLVNGMTKKAYLQANNAMSNTSKMDALCSQKAIAPHQVTIAEVAKIMAATPTEKLGEHRGLLCWHSTGSGKTVTSLAVILAYWDSPKRIVVVSSKSNVTKVMENYKDDAPRFFPAETKRIAAAYKQEKGATHLTDTEAFAAALARKVTGLTFVEARNRLAAKMGEFKTLKAMALHEGGGSVMIIDEAQGLGMKSKADPKGDAIKLGCALRRLTRDKLRKIHIFAMTATPGNTIKEWLKLLSVVRRANQLPFALDNDTGMNARGQRICEPSTTPGKDDSEMIEGALRSATPGPAPQTLVNYVKNNLSGLVAYVDIRSDLSRHACVKEINMHVPLDAFYYLALLKFNVVDRLRADRSISELAQHRYDPKMPDAFMRRMRVMGQTLPKTVWGTLPKEVQESFKKNRRILQINERSEGRLVSPKFIKLAEALSKPGKQYCYTVSGNENVLALALRKWFGMKDVSRGSEIFNGAHVNKAGKVVGLSPGNHVVVFNDAMQPAHRSRLVKIFNSEANRQGAYIRVVIASGQYYEGLDLYGLRFVHLAEPMVSGLHEAQAIGRGARNCSHRGLPLADRNVTIVRWSTAAPSGGWPVMQRLLGMMKGVTRGRVTVEKIEDEYKRIHGKTYDDVVFSRSRKDPQFFTLQKWEAIVKAFAIDCAMMKRYHGNVACGNPIIPSKIMMAAGRKCA